MSKNRIVEHIRKRRDIDTEFWSVRKILEMRNMGMWADSCCERIADAGKIDGEHVQIDWLECGNITLDWRGFGRVSRILEGYIGEEKWDELFEIFYERQEGIDKENSLIQMLREMDKDGLKNLIKEAESKLDKEDYKMVFEWLREERKARRLINRTYQKGKEMLSFLRVRIKYHRIFEFLGNYAENHSEGTEA